MSNETKSIHALLQSAYAEIGTYMLPVCLDFIWMQIADTTFRASDLLTG